MNIQDIKGWTYGFMKRNESQCVEYIVSLRDDALYAIQNKDYSKASALYRDVAYGMERLATIDQDTYEPPLYAAVFCVAKVEAFWLHHREEAVKQLQIAREVAKSCAAYGRTDALLADQDVAVLEKLLSKMETEAAFSDLISSYGEEAWNLANEAAFSSFHLENTVSGLGCIAFIVLLIVLVVLYSVVVTTAPNSFSA